MLRVVRKMSLRAFCKAPGSSGRDAENMTIPKRAVEVRQLPERLSGKQERMSLREIESCLNVDRPRVVLDCSNVRQLDRSVIHLLLCCLEEALKRNGDIKLAALPAAARESLKVTGVDRLFEIHDSIPEAVNSYHQLPTGAESRVPVTLRSDRETKSAA
jgi:anti-sigma B factor antagonist